MTFKSFPQAADGIYDHQQHLTRYLVLDNMPVVVISKDWIDNGGPADVGSQLKLCWGSFPDMPPKLTK